MIGGGMDESWKTLKIRVRIDHESVVCDKRYYQPVDNRDVDRLKYRLIGIGKACRAIIGRLYAYEITI